MYYAVIYAKSRMSNQIHCPENSWNIIWKFFFKNVVYFPFFLVSPKHQLTLDFNSTCSTNCEAQTSSVCAMWLILAAYV